MAYADNLKDLSTIDSVMIDIVSIIFFLNTYTKNKIVQILGENWL